MISLVMGPHVSYFAPACRSAGKKAIGCANSCPPLYNRPVAFMQGMGSRAMVATEHMAAPYTEPMLCAHMTLRPLASRFHFAMRAWLFLASLPVLAALEDTYAEAWRNGRLKG